MEGEQRQGPKDKPEIDLNYLAKLWPAAMAMATKMRREEEVELEQRLSALVRDYLVARGAISEEQRELVQMEVHGLGEFLSGDVVAYVRPGAKETPEYPRLALCYLKPSGWEVKPLPHEPF